MCVSTSIWPNYILFSYTKDDSYFWLMMIRISTYYLHEKCMKFVSNEIIIKSELLGNTKLQKLVSEKV